MGASRCGRRSLGLLGGVGRFEFREPGTELPIVVPEFPIGLGETLQSFSDAASPDQGDDGGQGSRRREQPVKGQQNSYLIERLATVSTGLPQYARLATPA
jgi:hypothetical protein